MPHYSVPQYLMHNSTRALLMPYWKGQFACCLPHSSVKAIMLGLEYSPLHPQDIAKYWTERSHDLNKTNFLKGIIIVAKGKQPDI